MTNNTKTPFDFPEVEGGISMSGILKPQTKIPTDFPITKCKTSWRGCNETNVIRPRKRGRPLSWTIAEALAPDADKSYDEQMAATTVTEVRHISPEESELIDRIKKLEKENRKLRGE